MGKRRHAARANHSTSLGRADSMAECAIRPAAVDPAARTGRGHLKRACDASTTASIDETSVWLGEPAVLAAVFTCASCRIDNRAEVDA